MTAVGPIDADDRSLPPPVLGEPAVLVDERKHPDRRHWRWWATRLGEDDHGVWLATPAGTVLRRGDEPVRTCRTPMAVLVPHDDPWLVECYLDHPRVLTYVNIGTVPTWHRRGTVVRQVDLDLDVVVRRDGTVALEDRDEFRAHRAGYPADLVRLAEVAATRAVALLGRDPDCFGGRRWLDRLSAAVDRGREHTDRGREHTDRGREHTDRGRAPADGGRAPTDRGRAPVERGRTPTDGQGPDHLPPA